MKRKKEKVLSFSNRITKRNVKKEDIDFIYNVYMDKSINPYLTHPVMDKTSFLPVFNELCGRYNDLIRKYRNHHWVSDVFIPFAVLSFTMKYPGYLIKNQP